MTLLNQICINSSCVKYLFCHEKTNIQLIVHPLLLVLIPLQALFLLGFFIYRWLNKWFFLKTGTPFDKSKSKLINVKNYITWNY